MMGILKGLMIVAFMMASATSATAQTKDRLDRRDTLLGFEAVGRLDSATGHCTAALITRDVILTAAHCVYDKGQAFTFHAGFRDGTVIATRTSTDIVIAQGYLDAQARDDRIAAISHDVALLRLASPIYETGANPYEIANTPVRGANLTLASYGQGRMAALTLERGCRLNTLYRNDVLGIDCDATFGSSGAPVFVNVHGRTRIMSIVSSGRQGVDGRPETLGIALSKLVPTLMTELRNKTSRSPVSPNIRRLKIGQKTTSGARFVRP
jgi:protease YdgD